MQVSFRTIALTTTLLAPLSLAEPLSAFQAEMTGAPVSIPSRSLKLCLRKESNVNG